MANFKATLNGVLVLLANFNDFTKCIKGECNPFSAMGICLSFGSIIAGIGITQRYRWAQVMIFILSALSIYFFIRYFKEEPRPEDGISQLVNFILFPFVVFSVFCAYIFSRPKIRSQLK